MKRVCATLMAASLMAASLPAAFAADQGAPANDADTQTSVITSDVAIEGNDIDLIVPRLTVGDFDKTATFTLSSSLITVADDYNNLNDKQLHAYVSNGKNVGDITFVLEHENGAKNYATAAHGGTASFSLTAGERWILKAQTKNSSGSAKLHIYSTRD